MSAAMERRYRAALDWYPKSWRDANGEAMLGTLLDEAEATGREKPRVGDVFNLVLNGLAVSARRLPSRVPTAVRDRVAAISLATGFALAVVLFVGGEWAPWAVNGPWNGWATDWRPMHREVPGFGPFASAGVILFGLWFAAFGLALIGLARTASFVLFATIPASLMLVDLSYDRMVALRPSDGVLVALACLAVLAMAGRPTRRGQKRRGAKWLAVSALVAVAAPAAIGANSILQNGSGSQWIYAGRLDPWGSWFISNPGVYLALAAVIAVLALARNRRDWAVAIGLASLPWVVTGTVIVVTAGSGLSIVVSAVLALAAAVLIGQFVLRAGGYRLVLQRRE